MLKLFSIFWKSRDSLLSWALLGILLICALADVAGVVYLSYWRNDFWSALQHKEINKFLPLIIKFTVIAFILVLTFAYNTYLQGKISLYWRESLTRYFVKNFHTFNSSDNPDQRIQEDCYKFPVLTVQIFAGILSSICRFVALASILWLLSPPISTIPGFLLWVMLVYVIAGTVVTGCVGRKYTGLQYINQQAEANFRFGLVQLRQDNNDHLHKERYHAVHQNILKILFKQKLLSLWSGSYGQASVIFPILILAPSYFHGALTFGALMQANSAMSESGDSLSYFVNNYGIMTQWVSCKLRLVSLISSVR